LVSLLDRRLSGTLVMETPAGQKSALTVKDGVPVKARAPQPGLELGTLLSVLGAADSASVERALGLARRDGLLLGAALVRMGAVPQRVVESTLAEQLARRILWMCALPPESAFGFYAGTDYLKRNGGPGVETDPLSLLWRCLRDHSSDRRVALVMERLSRAPLRLHVHSQVDRFGFDLDERLLVEQLRTSCTYATLLQRPGLDVPRLSRVLYALTLTRHLDLGDGREPIGLHTSVIADRDARLDSGFALRSRPTDVSQDPTAEAAADRADEARTEPFPRAPRVPVVDESSSSSISPSAPTERNLTGDWPPPAHIPSWPPPNSARATPPESWFGRDSRPPTSGSVPVAGRTDARATGGARRDCEPAHHPYDTGARGLESLRDSRPPESRAPSSPPPSSSASTASSVITGNSVITGSWADQAPRPEPVVELERDIVRAAAELDLADHYALLSVPRNATTRDVQDAFLQKAKRWHPDRLPPALAHRRDEAGRVFARLSEAQRVLADAEARRNYDTTLAGGESDEMIVRRTLTAAAEYRRAELLTKRGDFGAALPHAEAAQRQDPSRDEHGALYAYLVARSDEKLDESRLRTLEDLVDRAVKRTPDNARFRFYRGTVLKRAGRIEDAMREFRATLRLDRNSIDAARELRLYNLRKERESERPGLLGLFKRSSSAPPSKPKR
jgi:curved DNA-binding protein CbpA